MTHGSKLSLTSISKMSHHLVTVCMFCLLCAAHTCGAHVETKDVHTYEPTIDYNIPLDLTEKRKLEHLERYNHKLQKIRQPRPKRHLDDVSDTYIGEILKEYGTGDTMNLTGFNNMLNVLELSKLVQGRVETKEGPNQRNSVYCLNSSDLITAVNKGLYTDDHDHNDHQHTDPTHDHDVLITEDTLRAVCPVLLYQKLGKPDEKRDCVIHNKVTNTQTNLKSLDSAVTKTDKKDDTNKNMFAVWLYSFLSITAISACGLLGVAVIPIMHKTYYNHLLQFLVALAVGTLCGDALLHLMPHAMSPHDHDHGPGTSLETSTASHNDGMWKGLAAMLGVVFFYFTEKGLTVVVEWRKRRQKLEEDKLPSRVRVLKDETVGGCSGGAKAPITNSTTNSFLKIFKKDEKNDPTTKTCKHKYSEYPYCYDEIDTDTHDDHHLRDGQIPPSPKAKQNNSVSVVSSNALSAEGKEEPTAKDWLLKAEPSSVVEMNNIKHKEDGAKDLKDGDSYTVILREHSRAHHGHSHAHGHVHAPPSSLSSVAWMVIMGDGLHNFTDGMAIGAAFASNIAGGFSTAIAVLCHELPHELGDFAVLLKAGMSVKRAVCYNVLSSALCLGGMVCGVLAGHAPNATRWLFAAAAGMFLYIALVDMMPELSTSHSKEGTLCQCLLQLAGLATGIGIMLVIALYEEDLKTLFG